MGMKQRSMLSLQFSVFFAGLVLLLPLRCYQYLRIIEPVTGFYKGRDFSFYLLYALLAAFVLFFLLSSFLKRKQLRFAPVAGKSAFTAVACFLACAALLWDGLYSFLRIFGNLDGLLPGKELFRTLIKTGILPLSVEAVAAVVAAVYFALLGYCAVKQRSGSAFRLLALAPMVWAIGRIVLRFVRTVSFINVSELLFEMLMLVFFLLCFMAFIQLNGNINSAGLDWKIAGYGFPAALLCLLCFVPRLVMLLCGKGDVLAEQSPCEPCDLAMALVLLSVIGTRLESKGTTEG